jgi:hypothetical protein
MAMSCQDVSARMLELIYGELGDDERATLETHIAGCADCRAERQGLERTRAVARQALDEPVPARARAAILAAAAAQAAAAAAPSVAAGARTATAAAAPARAPRPPERRSFWDWVRARWTLPTLATVGAVAVFVLGSRLFLSPEKTYERGRQALAPAPAPAAAPSAALERQGPGASGVVEGSPAPAVAANEAAKQEEQAPAPRDDGAEKGARDKKSVHHNAGKRAVADDEPAPTGKPDLRGGRLDALLGKVGKADKGFGGSALSGLGDEADRESPRLKAKDEIGAAHGATSSGSAIGGVANRGEGRAFAPPPPPAAAPPAAKTRAADLAAAPKPEKPAKKEIADQLFAEPPPPRAQPASPAPVAEGSRPAPLEEEARESTTAMKRKAPARRAPEPAAPPLASAPPSSEKASGGKASEQKSAPAGAAAAPARAAATAVQRADRLFAEGRWIEAAAAYRELLRNDPRNGDADRWRKRLAMAQAEIDVSRRPSEKASAAPAR